MVDAMIMPVWLSLMGLGALFTVIAFLLRDPRVFYFHVLAGVMWFVVGFESGSLHELVVYSTTNSLKEFHYPSLIILFTVLAGVHFVFAVYTIWEVVADESRSLSSTVSVTQGKKGHKEFGDW